MKLSLAVIGLIFSLLLPLLATAGGKLYFYHNDNRGAPVKMTDPSGKVVWSAEYDPYGKATVNDDPDGDGIKVENNIRLPGQYADDESGLHYNYRRTYDPKTGRYLTSDPIGLDGGLNTFGYANGNPIRFTDPTGEAVCGGACSGFGLGLTARYILRVLGSRAAAAGSIGMVSEIIDLDKKRKEKEGKQCPPDPGDDDPCLEWYEEMIGIYVAIHQKLIDHDDLTKQVHNESARNYNANMRSYGLRRIAVI